MRPRVDDLPVGGRVWFAEEKRPYTVQARSARYLVCTKPFAAKRTVLYCIIDLKTRMRAPEDLVFGFGAETTAQCEAMVRRLEKDESGLSRRREAPLAVVRVEHPVPPKPSFPCPERCARCGRDLADCACDAGPHRFGSYAQ